MKRIVSVSLGSSKRDHSTTVTLLGEQFDVRRVGVDGDIDKALIKLREFGWTCGCHRVGWNRHIFVFWK
ncbi:hypothetical protein M1N67_02105 [Peptococcaceae bacterium]|nr:hypothetical protein [Peptococcaceae bacterium]